MEPPVGYATTGKVWKLHKALYGLKQAGKEWSDDFATTLTGMGFIRSIADPCVFHLRVHNTCVIIVVHVDDCLVKYDHESQLKFVLDGLQKRYKLSDLGEVKHALGVDFLVGKESISLSQQGYTESVLERFGFTQAHAAHTPSSVSISAGKSTGLEKFEMNASVGALLWLSMNTRPMLSRG